MKSHPMLPNHFGHLVYFLVTRLLLPALACGLLFVLAGVGINTLARLGVIRNYTASVVMEIRSDPPVLGMGNDGGTARRQRIELENMLQHDLRTRSALLQVISDVDMLNELVPRDPQGNPTWGGLQTQERLVARIGKSIQIRILARNDDVMRVEVSCTDTYGAVASEIVNTLVNNYVETASASVDQTLKAVSGFFRRQRDIYAQMLAKAEAEMMQFMNDNPGLDPDHPDAFREMLADREANLRDLKRKIHPLRVEREALQQFVNEQPETFGGDAANPPVPNVERIRTLRDIATLSARISVLDSEISDLEEQIKVDELVRRKLPQLTERMTALLRKVKEHRTQYTFWSTQLRDANVDLQAAIDGRYVHLTVLSRSSKALAPDGLDLAYLWPIAVWSSIGVGVLCYLTQLLINATTPRRSKDEPAAG